MKEKKIKPAYLIGLVVLIALAALSFMLLSGYADNMNAAMAGIDKTGLDAAALAHEQASARGNVLGILTILPFIITVALAFITKEVIGALLAGIFSGILILVGSAGTSGGFLAGIHESFGLITESILAVTTDSFKSAIIVLCLCIGGMVAVINAAGGFAALGQKITKGINSPRRASLMAQAMGMCLFFDDYANSLITGPVMRRITDKQGVSREKLAYIVDSTAAPVAGIALISSWIAAELAAIDAGFAVAGVQASAYGHFLGSIPFCFYNFLAIGFLLITTLSGREYGPMLLAERRARAGHPLKPGSASEGTDDNTNGATVEPGSIWTAILPILTMCLYTFVGFYINGVSNAVEAGVIAAGAPFSFSLISTAFGYADTVVVLMRAALLSSLVAIFMGCLTRKITLSGGIGKWVSGASTILLTAIILVLAWTFSYIVGELGTAYYLVDFVTMNLPYWLLPVLIFLTCCAISFAAGSFGCMVMVMPIGVTIAYQTAISAAVPYQDPFIFACIAAVLSGSIFGDHCSPVTDTTILSSLGAGCDNLDHVKTQLPYALTVALVASVVGYLPAGFGFSPFLSIPLGIGACILIIRLIGKKVETTSDIGVE
ncbi:MAG: Na+/H+ antiporter NhaC family protein [Oscillospiraceae bacterium]